MPGADWHEIPKLINLIEHFNHHDELSNGEISISDFLIMHYSGSDSKNHEEHKNLPFHHLCNSGFIALVSAFEYSFYTLKPVNQPTELYSFSVVRDHIPNVWQPPRV